MSGFRVLGKRAVRIDILERLADLIRPALAWKPGHGPRPVGAYDGSQFVVTPAMLSILGATPDDMTEILRGLGYRSDTLSAEFVDQHLAELDAAVPVTAARLADGTEIPAVEVVIKKSFASAVAEAQATEALVAEGSAGSQEPVIEPVGVAPSAAEPKVTLVWRQVRHDERKPEHRARPAGQRTRAAPSNGEAKPEQKRDDRPRRDAKPGDDGGKRHGRPKFDKRRDGETTAGEKPRHERKHDGAKPANFQSKPREERPAKFDPDSPFAKLAALRDQLKK